MKLVAKTANGGFKGLHLGPPRVIDHCFLKYGKNSPLPCHSLILALQRHHDSAVLLIALLSSDWWGFKKSQPKNIGDPLHLLIYLTFLSDLSEKCSRMSQWIFALTVFELLILDLSCYSMAYCLSWYESLLDANSQHRCGLMNAFSRFRVDTLFTAVHFCLNSVKFLYVSWLKLEILLILYSPRQPDLCVVTRLD